MIAAKVEVRSSSKIMGFVRQYLFGSAWGHANKAFSSFTTELSVLTDLGAVMIWESQLPGTVS